MELSSAKGEECKFNCEDSQCPCTPKHWILPSVLVIAWETWREPWEKAARCNGTALLSHFLSQAWKSWGKKIRNPWNLLWEKMQRALMWGGERATFSDTEQEVIHKAFPSSQPIFNDRIHICPVRGKRRLQIFWASSTRGLLFCYPMVLSGRKQRKSFWTWSQNE